MFFDVVKICRNDPNTAWVVDRIEGADNAIELARLHAEVHYQAILGDTGTLRNCRYGAKFDTNNGTPVSYVARAHSIHRRGHGKISD